MLDSATSACWATYLELSLAHDKPCCTRTAFGGLVRALPTAMTEAASTQPEHHEASNDGSRLPSGDVATCSSASARKDANDLDVPTIAAVEDGKSAESLEPHGAKKTRTSELKSQSGVSVHERGFAKLPVEDEILGDTPTILPTVLSDRKPLLVLIVSAVSVIFAASSMLAMIWASDGESVLGLASTKVYMPPAGSLARHHH